MKKIIFKNNNIDLKLIKEYLETGKIIIYPTDTVYGVGASIKSIDGIKKIYTSKNRDLKLPLIALISKKENINKVAYVNEKQKKIVEILIEKYWPGPLTIILNKKKCVPEIMVSNGKTVGVRLPDLKLTRDIIEGVGGVIPTTSANISGEKSSKKLEEISEKFKEKADIIVETLEISTGIESTVVDLTKNIPVIIREGAIKKEELIELFEKYKIGGKK